MFCNLDALWGHVGAILGGLEGYLGQYWGYLEFGPFGHGWA